MYVQCLLKLICSSKQIEFLNSSLEEPTIPELSTGSEPSSQKTNDDISIHELLNSLSLVQ